MTSYLQGLIDIANTEASDAGDFVKRLGGEEKVKQLIVALLVDQMENGGGGGGGGITALTGNVTASGTGSVVATIANDAVTYAKMQNVSATDKVLGRSTSGAGDVEEIACTAAGRALLDDASAAAQRVTLGWTDAAIADAIIATDADTVGFRAILRATWASTGRAIDKPTNGSDGQIIQYVIIASGGARTIGTLGAGIKTAYGVTFETSIASGNTRVIELEKNGSNWLMIKNIEFAA
jgi:hypothetical protein